MKDKVLLVDFDNQLWRSTITFGAVKHIKCESCNSNLHISNSHCVCGESWEENCIDNGRNVLIYNFFRNLRPLVEQFSPDKCFIVSEGHPQFRYDIYANYKSDRIIKNASKKKEDSNKFNDAKNKIVDILKYFPITFVKAHAYEADDTIATLAENMKEEDVTIISNDSDYLQLLQKGYDSCKIYNPIKKEFMVEPKEPYIAWKSLNGDKSDSIPAILKPKKALDTVNDPVLFAKFMEIEENRSLFNINRSLIEFRQVPLEELILEEGVKDFSKVKEEFTKLKFESMTNDKSWLKFTETFNCLKF